MILPAFNHPAMIVPLTNSRFVALVSPEDYGRCMQFTWHLKRSHSNSYVSRTFWKGKGKYGTMRLHRFIMREPKDKDVHHKDGNPLVNIRENLVEVEKFHGNKYRFPK